MRTLLRDLQAFCQEHENCGDAERILPNVMRCYQEFRNELDQPMDLPRMLAGMERLRGARTEHTCL